MISLPRDMLWSQMIFLIFIFLFWFLLVRFESLSPHSPISPNLPSLSGPPLLRGTLRGTLLKHPTPPPAPPRETFRWTPTPLKLYYNKLFPTIPKMSLYHESLFILCSMIWGKCLEVYGVYRRFQQYFSSIVAVSVIGGWKPEYPKKTTDLFRGGSRISS